MTALTSIVLTRTRLIDSSQQDGRFYKRRRKEGGKRGKGRKGEKKGKGREGRERGKREGMNLVL